MFGSYTFLIFMLIFTLPPIIIVWTLFHGTLWRNKHIVGWVIVIALVSQAISDQVAMRWHAWFFPRETTLGIWINGFPIENLIYTVLVSVAISSAVLSFISLEERKSLGVKK